MSLLLCVYISDILGGVQYLCFPFRQLRLSDPVYFSLVCAIIFIFFVVLKHIHYCTCCTLESHVPIVILIYS